MYNNIEEVFNPTLENTIGPRTTNIDNWGYWRGSKKSGKLFPKMKTLSSVPYDVGYELISDDRQPTGDNVDATLLKKSFFRQEAVAFLSMSRIIGLRAEVLALTCAFRLGDIHNKDKRNCRAGHV